MNLRIFTGIPAAVLIPMQQVGARFQAGAGLTDTVNRAVATCPRAGSGVLHSC